MTTVWHLLKYVPLPVKRAVRGVLPERARFWLRERLGGGCETIPDKVIAVPDGRQFHIGPDYIYLPLHRGEEFEPDATRVFRKLVRAGDVMVDVGANYGWYTTLAAQLVGTEGRVFAFEPVPSTFERLSEHIELNSVTQQVQAVRSAVGTERGSVTMHVFDELSHSRSSVSTLGREAYEQHVAPVIDLDSFLSEQQIADVDFMKCDVEGAEMLVLKGAAQLLSSPSAPMVMLEMNEETSNAFGYSAGDLWKQLVDYGYDRFYEIRPGGRLRPAKTEMEARAADILVACKGDRIDQRMGDPVARAA